MKKIRVLSLDGGGIKGVIPAYVLQYVEKKLIEISKNKNARLSDYFDIIVGTSTGGILSCFYLMPEENKDKDGPNSKFPASKALEFYEKYGYDIFNKSKRYGYLGLRQFFNATNYSAKTLEELFEKYFGDVKMHELIKPILVTTYNLEKKSSFFFTSYKSEISKQDFFVKEVARSTSAAPTYFSPARISNKFNNKIMHNIDGGVFANNPTMCAYAECRKTKFDKIEYPSAKDLVILSLGTGGGQIDLKDLNTSASWGLASWGKAIPNIMMDGSNDTVAYQMKQLYNSLEEEHKYNYKRIDVPKEARKYSSDMAEASDENIGKLKQAGEAALIDANKEKESELKLDDFIRKFLV